jgi:hypothetical protein
MSRQKVRRRDLVPRIEELARRGTALAADARRRPRRPGRRLCAGRLHVGALSYLSHLLVGIRLTASPWGHWLLCHVFALNK